MKIVEVVIENYSTVFDEFVVIVVSVIVVLPLIVL